MPCLYNLLVLLTDFITPVAKERLGGEKPVKDLTRTVFHDGIERTFHIHLPPEFHKDAPPPLVLALHGGGSEGREFDRITGSTLSDAADKRGVVLAFPEGIDRHWYDGRTEIVKKSYDDVGFNSKIIDTMVRDDGIDPGHVYVTGISNGGFMAVRLAVDLSDKIAAVAPVAAQLSKAIEDKAPVLPISTRLVNGTADPVVPFNGGKVRFFRFGRSGGEILSTVSTIEHFRRYNGCRTKPENIKRLDRYPNDRTKVEIEEYAGGRDETEVILVKVIGGGHTWPGGLQYLKPGRIGVVSQDINAGEMMLDFFLRHERKGSSVQ